MRDDSVAPDGGAASAGRQDAGEERDSGAFRISRRGALLGGSLGVGGLVVGGVGGLTFDVPVAAAAALPTTTAPEQLRLLWGADPATEVTVSWSSPGTVPMPAPMLAFSTALITAENPGNLCSCQTRSRWISRSRGPDFV